MEEIAPNSGIFVGDGKISWRDNIEEAFNFAALRYVDAYENELQYAFNKFDVDGSGTIDKGELA